MNAVKVLYYYYYLFYTKVLVQSEPHLVTVLALSFIQSLWASIIIDIIALSGFCYHVDKWPRIFIAILMIGTNYWYFHERNNAKEIISSKPNFFGNHKLTVLTVLVMSLIGVSWMFWGSFYARNILQNCT